MFFKHASGSPPVSLLCVSLMCVFPCSTCPSCSTNRASPSCPLAPLPTFRPPSTPSSLASRDCESHTSMHTHKRTQPSMHRSNDTGPHTGIWPPVMAAQSRPKCVFALARCQRIPGRFRCQNELVFWSSFSLPGIRPLSRPAGGRLRPRPSTALLPLIRF